MAGALATDVSSEAASLVGSEVVRQVYGTPDASGTRALVTNGWAQAQIYAANAFTAANNYLNALGTAANSVASIPNVDTALTHLSAATTTFTAFAENLNLTAPPVTFTDTTYDSRSLTNFSAIIDSWVTGVTASGLSVDTGLPAAVEQMIWDRGRARESIASSKKSQEALRQFAARGHSKPPGALAIQLLDAAQEAQNSDSSFSRDVAIKQADLAQSNRRFAFEMAEKIQVMLIQDLSSRMQRALDAAKATAQMIAETNGQLAQAYAARAGFAGSLVGAQAQQLKATSDIIIAEGNLRVEAARTNIQALIQKATLLVESIRASAQIQGQLASSALSAVNLSGGLHDSTSWALAVSESRSRSVSASISSSSGRQENYTP